jgi:hypothetical protein
VIQSVGTIFGLSTNGAETEILVYLHRKAMVQVLQEDDNYVSSIL